VAKFGNMTVISRKEWNAAPPTKPRTRRAPSSIREVFFHWPGSEPRSWERVDTQSEEEAILRSFQRSHQGQGWADIGYNHVMGNADAVPRLYTGRGAQFVPAAQLGHNTGTIACCILIGPEDFLRGDIIVRMRSYVRACEQFAGHRLRVRGHGEVVSTDCPGPQIRKALNSGALDIH
jgi:hypothetical protein